jgi:hypothetical protein
MNGINVSIESNAETVLRLCASAFNTSRALLTIAIDVSGVKSLSISLSGVSDFASSAATLSGGVSEGSIPKNPVGGRQPSEAMLTGKELRGNLSKTMVLELSNKCGILGL